MPQPLRVEDIHTRLHDYARDNYLFLGNVTKGVALAVATTILLQIVGDFRSEWTRMTPWLASLVGIVATYVTTHSGILMTNSRANSLDSMLPLVMGIAEFLLFGILFVNKDHPVLWLNWFLCVALHALVGVAIVQNRIWNVNPAVDYGDQDLGKSYEESLIRNRNGAALLSLVSIGAWLSVRCWIFPQSGIRAAAIAQFVLAIPFIFSLAIIIQNSNTDRRLIDDYVSRALAKGAGQVGG